MITKQTNLEVFENSNDNFWSKYNLAKTNEKKFFYVLLNEICNIIPEPFHNGRGRKPIAIKDLIFMSALKIYCNFSLRKIYHDVREASEFGYIECTPHFNKISNFFNNPVTYDLLKRILLITSMPLKNLEDNFSIDSSGFGGYQQERWSRAKTNTTTKFDKYLKGHICIGTKTNIIISAEVTDGKKSDSKQVPKLSDNLHIFNPAVVSADKAYSDYRTFQIIESLGAMPIIQFKDNAVRSGKKSPEIWKKMFDYFENNRKEFDVVYHKRSNVETTFSMIKLKLGGFLRSKNFEAQRNELMMKFIVHNMTVLVQEIFERNVHIDFKKCLLDIIKFEDQKNLLK